MITPLCQNCGFWNEQKDEENNQSGSGVCFGSPPRVVMIPKMSRVQPQQMGIQPATVRPTTNAEDPACGTWMPNADLQKELDAMRKCGGGGSCDKGECECG